MLIQFSFGNFRSFRDKATLSMVAASKIHSDPERDTANVFVAKEAKPRLELLKVAALYGANASGKSNVFYAVHDFSMTVQMSANIGFSSNAIQFRLNNYSHQEPVFYEVVFLTEEVQFRYGFALNLGAEKFDVASEWLYQAKNANEIMLFERTGDWVNRSRSFGKETSLLEEGHLRRTNALYLSMSAQIGNSIASKIVSFISSKLGFIEGISDNHLHDFTVNCVRKDRFRQQISDLLREADTGISNVLVRPSDDTSEFDLSSLPPEASSEEKQQLLSNAQQFVRVLASHPEYNRDGDIVGTKWFSLNFLESQGTQKLFAYAGLIFATLENGNILFVDEMDARFHPLLTRAIIRLFQSPEMNPKNAQLIFVTHDTNLLDPKRNQFRRDQIYFVEKDRYGASHLYSLAEFKGVRKNDAFEENYLQGRFGAIPFLGGLDRLMGADGKNMTSDADTTEKVGTRNR